MHLIVFPAELWREVLRSLSICSSYIKLITSSHGTHWVVLLNLKTLRFFPFVCYSVVCKDLLLTQSFYFVFVFLFDSQCRFEVQDPEELFTKTDSQFLSHDMTKILSAIGQKTVLIAF